MSANNSVVGDAMGKMAQEGSDSRRYMFAVELKAGNRMEYVWDPKDVGYIKKLKEMAAEEREGLRQTLIIRRAVIGPSAKENEVQVVSAEITDPEAETVKFPMVILSQGKEVQASVDITFPEVPDVKIKFTLDQGAGPVHLIGYHFIETSTEDDGEYSSEAEEEEEADDVDEAEQAETVEISKARPVVAKRRMQNNDGANGELKAKKAKVSKNGAANGADEEMENEEPVE